MMHTLYAVVAVALLLELARPSLATPNGPAFSRELGGMLPPRQVARQSVQYLADLLTKKKAFDPNTCWAFDQAQPGGDRIISEIDGPDANLTDNPGSFPSNLSSDKLNVQDLAPLNISSMYFAKGAAHLFGLGAEKDQAKAVGYLGLSARLGNPLATLTLARGLELGGASALSGNSAEAMYDLVISEFMYNKTIAPMYRYSEPEKLLQAWIKKDDSSSKAVLREKEYEILQACTTLDLDDVSALAMSFITGMGSFEANETFAIRFAAMGAALSCPGDYDISELNERILEAVKSNPSLQETEAVATEVEGVSLLPCARYLPLSTTAFLTLVSQFAECAERDLQDLYPDVFPAGEGAITASDATFVQHGAQILVQQMSENYPTQYNGYNEILERLQLGPEGFSNSLVNRPFAHKMYWETCQPLGQMFAILAGRLRGFDFVRDGKAFHSATGRTFTAGQMVGVAKISYLTSAAYACHMGVTGLGVMALMGDSVFNGWTPEMEAETPDTPPDPIRIGIVPRTPDAMMAFDVAASMGSFESAAYSAVLLDHDVSEVFYHGFSYDPALWIEDFRKAVPNLLAGHLEAEGRANASPRPTSDALDAIPSGPPSPTTRQTLEALLQDPYANVPYVPFYAFVSSRHSTVGGNLLGEALLAKYSKVSGDVYAQPHGALSLLSHVSRKIGADWLLTDLAPKLLHSGQTADALAVYLATALAGSDVALRNAAEMLLWQLDGGASDQFLPELSVRSLARDACTRDELDDTLDFLSSAPASGREKARGVYSIVPVRDRPVIETPLTGRSALVHLGSELIAMRGGLQDPGDAFLLSRFWALDRRATAMAVLGLDLEGEMCSSQAGGPKLPAWADQELLDFLSLKGAVLPAYRELRLGYSARRILMAARGSKSLSRAAKKALPHAGVAGFVDEPLASLLDSCYSYDSATRLDDAKDCFLLTSVLATNTGTPLSSKLPLFNFMNLRVQGNGLAAHVSLLIQNLFELFFRGRGGGLRSDGMLEWIRNATSLPASLRKERDQGLGQPSFQTRGGAAARQAPLCVGYVYTSEECFDTLLREEGRIIGEIAEADRLPTGDSSDKAARQAEIISAIKRFFEVFRGAPSQSHGATREEELDRVLSRARADPSVISPRGQYEVESDNSPYPLDELKLSVIEPEGKEVLLPLRLLADCWMVAQRCWKWVALIGSILAASFFA